jgi:hypothetical protein
MSTRLSFLNIRNLETLGLQIFLDGMNSEKFSTSQPAGFLLDRESARQIEGRYVQKISSVETFHDPFGKQFSYTRVFYTEQKFLLRLKSPILSSSIQIRQVNFSPAVLAIFQTSKLLLKI